MHRLRPHHVTASLVFCVLALAFFARWDSTISVDNRTYTEMTAGVVRHGLPWVDNGPVTEFVELRARWNTLHNGHLWGSLPPVFPYFAAPFFALGGLRLVIQVNVALLALLALGVARLCARITRDPWLGALSAWLTVAAAPVWCSTLDVSPYSFAIALSTWSVALSWEALDAVGAPMRRAAFLAGITGALATGAHLLSAPMLAATLALFALLPGSPDEPPASFEAYLRGMLGDREAHGRLLYGALGAALLLAPVSLLNHYRFGSFNPVSYGPCVWQSCAVTGLNVQGVGPMLVWLSPVILWAALTLGSLWALRGHLRAQVVAALVALCALAPPGVLHDRTLATALLAYGFVIDSGPVPMGHGYVVDRDGLGVFLGPYVVRSLVQSAPLVSLALLAPVTSWRERRAVLALALPCVALLAALLLRANIPAAYALGFPFITMRYVMPAVPALVILAVWAVSRAEVGWRWLLAAVPLGVGLGAWLAPGVDDGPHLRREVLLHAPLLLSVVTLGLLARCVATKSPWLLLPVRSALALSVGLSLGGALGSDLQHGLRTRSDHKAYLARLDRYLPRRFAVIAWPMELDPIVSRRDRYDMQYADLYETRDWRFLPLVQRWWAEGRPVFAIHHAGDRVGSPWPGVRYVAVDQSVGVWRVLPDVGR